MSTGLRRVAFALAIPVALALSVIVYFAGRMLARELPLVQPGTVLASLSRDSCDGCHAPIAAEWRESFHFHSLTGPFWERIRGKGYETVFKVLRIACVNCHAPANVLDLAEGEKPAQRSDDVGRGVDCVSCHVSTRGIHGTGSVRVTAHEVIGDERFRDPAVASVTVCASCHEEAEHARTVTAWRKTNFARDGVTCLHCHMPEVKAPSVSGGEPRLRRSHRFIGDKNDELLRKALNASIVTTSGGKAVVRIINDRAGHSLPASGMNSVMVKVVVHDQGGRMIQEEQHEFGTKERIPEYLDFWPFLQVTKIPYGESREIVVQLPPGPGSVSAEFWYRDWVTTSEFDRLIERITKPF